MRRMLDAWDHHLVHPSLPRTLTPRLHEAGFGDVTADGYAFVTTALDPETYGGSLMGMIYQYAVEHGGMDAADAQAWKAEQKQLAARGEFYFACTQVCFGARRR
jgi:arsenite methyltransferase